MELFWIAAVSQRKTSTRKIRGCQNYGPEKQDWYKWT